MGAITFMSLAVLGALVWLSLLLVSGFNAPVVGVGVLAVLVMNSSHNTRR